MQWFFFLHMLVPSIVIEIKILLIDEILDHFVPHAVSFSRHKMTFSPSHCFGIN
jgi:hypothetical protein